jgi:hypothetical protein
MSETQTAEQGAKHLMGVFRSHKTPADRDFMADTLRADFQNGPFGASDFEPAVRVAVANGWIVDMGKLYRLTEAGYEVANR